MSEMDFYALDRPLDWLRAKLRFFFVVLAFNLINIPMSIPFFIVGPFNCDWSYWKIGVRVMCWYLWCAGIKVETKGLEKIQQDRPAIYVSNHQSEFDIALVMTQLAVRFYFLAKKELLRIPIFGWALRTLGMLMIDRSTTTNAYMSIKEAAWRIKNEGHNVFIYPEGGITKTGQLQHFKKGAFVLAVEAGVPIVPIIIHGSGRLFNASRMESRPGKAKVEVLEEIDTSGYTQKTKEELIRKVYEVMKKAEERKLAVQTR